jgi:hypothetical protein
MRIRVAMRASSRWCTSSRQAARIVGCRCGLAGGGFGLVQQLVEVKCYRALHRGIQIVSVPQTAVPAGYSWVYRAVSAGEYRDILQTRPFRQRPTAAINGTPTPAALPGGRTIAPTDRSTQTASVRTCCRTSFQNSMSDRTPGPPCEVGQDKGCRPHFASSQSSTHVRRRFQPPSIAPQKFGKGGSDVSHRILAARPSR